MTKPAHLLLLAGSGEGRAIAGVLAEGDLRVTASVAEDGHWSGPLPLPTRIGGFGGAEAFADFLRAEGITAVLDATHPFADRISARSWQVCAELGLPFLQVDRPPWQAGRGDRWTHVPDAAAAAALIPPGARVFATIGRPLIGPFHDKTRVYIFLRRLSETPGVSDCARITYVAGTGPFTVDQETRSFRDLGITHLVCKNSGGEISRTKLDAARRLGLPVILIDRPASTGAPVVRTVEQALEWVGDTCR